MADMPNKVSPLDALAQPHIGNGEIGVILSERLCDSLVQVQAWPNTIKQLEKAVYKLANNDTVVMPTGPGRWLIDSDTEGLEERLRNQIMIDKAAVTGLTHARVVVNVQGPKAEWVLSSGIALDFSQDAFPIGETKLSHHHEIGLTIHRLSEYSFDLYVFTSLARSFWKWIERAGKEVGLTVS